MSIQNPDAFEKWIYPFIRGGGFTQRLTMPICRDTWNAAITAAAERLEAMNSTEPALFAKGEWNAVELTKMLAAKLVADLQAPD